jgi:hypothetical protein
MPYVQAIILIVPSFEKMKIATKTPAHKHLITKLKFPSRLSAFVASSFHLIRGHNFKRYALSAFIGYFEARFSPN